MMSIRAVARSIPRSVPRSVFRSPVSAFRPLSTISRPSLLQTFYKPTQRQPYLAFSTSPTRKEPAGDSDLELSAKIDQEVRLEKDSKDPAALPESCQAYLSRGLFEIEDKPGSEEVTLNRTFGDETIKVGFTIADMNAMDEDQADMDEDAALGDEDGDLVDDQSRPRRTINQSGTKGGSVDVMSEDSIAPADAQREDEDALAEQRDSSGFPAQLNITVTKPGKGAVQITATADDGLIEVEDVFYFQNADLAEPNTAEKMHARQHVYAGPPFGNLDSDLQAMLERYLDERGINTELATFVPDYIDYKEQREYVQWLENMKDFIDA